MITLKKRSSFLYIRQGSKWVSAGFILQARKRKELAQNASNPAVEALSSDLPTRFGFTATKKIGNAVKRNRAKRRLKEAVRVLQLDNQQFCRLGYDYVLIARHTTIKQDFQDLIDEMRVAFRRIHTISKKKSSNNKKRTTHKT